MKKRRKRGYRKDRKPRHPKGRAWHKRTYRTPREVYLLQLPTENEVFSGTSLELKALRQALGWTQRELGAVLGLHVDNFKCWSLARWEQGKSHPRGVYLTRLVQLVDAVKADYIKELEAVTYRKIDKETGKHIENTVKVTPKSNSKVGKRAKRAQLTSEGAKSTPQGDSS